MHLRLNRLEFIDNENTTLQYGSMFLTTYQIHAKYRFNQFICMSTRFETTENFQMKFCSLLSVLVSSIDYPLLFYFSFFRGQLLRYEVIYCAQSLDQIDQKLGDSQYLQLPVYKLFLWWDNYYRWLIAFITYAHLQCI